MCILRQLISAGSRWESEVGYSRAVVVGDTIAFSGTAGEGEHVYAQTQVLSAFSLVHALPFVEVEVEVEVEVDAVREGR